MIETIANAVVELARYAVAAYAIHCGRDVLVHWLNRIPAKNAADQILDTASAAGIDLRTLADKQGSSSWTSPSTCTTTSTPSLLVARSSRSSINFSPKE